jgi:uncharacterized membrane protein YfcA
VLVIETESHLMADVPLAAAILIAAILYSSVGHAGASGYLAAMALMGVAPATMKPTALVLNVLVASIASFQFVRAGRFSWSVFWPFALASVPLAFVGGALTLPSAVYKQLLGAALIYSAWRLVREARRADGPSKPPPIVAAMFFGGLIGLASGMIGVGGGIFLSPLLLFMGWARTRDAAGVSAVFILVNSIAALGGQLTSLSLLPPQTPLLAAAAVVGGTIGSFYGSRTPNIPMLRRLLAVVLVIAGTKMLLAW